MIYSAFQEIIGDLFENMSSIPEGCMDYQVQVRFHASKSYFFFELTYDKPNASNI